MSGQRETKPTNIVKGDEILIFSRKRKTGRRVKVKQVFQYTDIIHFDTPAGRVSVPPNANVQIPTVLPNL